MTNADAAFPGRSDVEDDRYRENKGTDLCSESIR